MTPPGYEEDLQKEYEKQKLLKQTVTTSPAYAGMTMHQIISQLASSTKDPNSVLNPEVDAMLTELANRSVKNWQQAHGYFSQAPEEIAPVIDTVKQRNLAKYQQYVDTGKQPGTWPTFMSPEFLLKLITPSGPPKKA